MPARVPPSWQPGEGEDEDEQKCLMRGAPLIRYCIGDAGGVIDFDEMMRLLAERGFDPVADDRSQCVVCSGDGVGCSPVRLAG